MSSIEPTKEKNIQGNELLNEINDYRAKHNLTPITGRQYRYYRRHGGSKQK